MNNPRTLKIGQTIREDKIKTYDGKESDTLYNTRRRLREDIALEILNWLVLHQGQPVTVSIQSNEELQLNGDLYVSFSAVVCVSEQQKAGSIPTPKE